jgi:2-oxoisovalerate dehydrogenase E1 component
MQFADFVSTGFNPIVNYWSHRWKTQMVVRMPCGGGTQAGLSFPTNEAWFTKTPG